MTYRISNTFMVWVLAIAHLNLINGELINPKSLYKRDGGSHSHSSSSSYGAPEPSYSAPSSSYSAPSPSYSAPSPSYSAPEPSYGAPEPSYESPATSYEEPETGYGPPSSGYGEVEESGGLDLTSLLIPVLALLGLSLLFPTYVSLTTVKRKKRATDDALEEGKSNIKTQTYKNIHFRYFRHKTQIKKQYRIVHKNTIHITVSNDSKCEIC